MQSANTKLVNVLTSHKTKIGIFTGTRAEYGLMRNLIRKLVHHPDYDTKLIVSGSHLSKRYGQTIAEITSDGIKSIEEVKTSLDRTPMPSMALITSEVLIGVSAVLERFGPKLLFVLGDRYECFAAATAAHLLGIPIVHLHGGEKTSGAIDDRLRNAISQMSTWHFTAAELYRENVIRMGHPANNVICVGPMVIDMILDFEPCSRSIFEAKTGFRFSNNNILFTYHPETLAKDYGMSGLLAFLESIDRIECNVLFTYPNADQGSIEIKEAILDYVHTRNDKCYAIPSLGQIQYLNALYLFDVVAGNSSSGIIEAPLIGVPVVNIGLRQHGRLRFGNVHDVEDSVNRIYTLLKELLALSPRSTSQQNGKAELLSRYPSAPSDIIVGWLESSNYANDSQI